ncbi:MAG: hypothetical protein ACK5L5_04220 [Bacteroidales bacterium]
MLLELLEMKSEAHKEELVAQYSEGETTSLRELYTHYPRAYALMVRNMQNAYNNDPEVKKLRSGLLHRMQKHGIDTTNWNEVNKFLWQTKIAGKLLFHMSKTEMRALTRKLESILKKRGRKKEACNWEKSNAKSPSRQETQTLIIFQQAHPTAMC